MAKDNQQPVDGKSKELSPGERLLDALKMGCTRKAAAAAGEMTAEELERKIAEEPKLAVAARFGRGRAQYELVRAIWDNRDWRAKAWLLEHWLSGSPEGEGLDDDESQRDDLAHRRLREDLAETARRAGDEAASAGGDAGAGAECGGPAEASPA